MTWSRTSSRCTGSSRSWWAGRWSSIPRSRTTRWVRGRRSATRCRPTSTTRSGRTRSTTACSAGPRSAASVDGFVCFDLVVHGWDLARATGQDETIDPEDIEQLQAMVDSMGPMMVENGVIEAPARAGARRVAAGTAAGRPRTAGLTP